MGERLPAETSDKVHRRRETIYSDLTSIDLFNADPNFDNWLRMSLQKNPSVPNLIDAVQARWEHIAYLRKDGKMRKGEEVIGTAEKMACLEGEEYEKELELFKGESKNHQANLQRA